MGELIANLRATKAMLAELQAKYKEDSQKGKEKIQEPKSPTSPEPNENAWKTTRVRSAALSVKVDTVPSSPRAPESPNSASPTPTKISPKPARM